MGILQFLLGAVILAAIIADIFTNTLTARGGGFVSIRTTRVMWVGALSLHQRQARPRLLTLAGPLITASVVLIWVAAMWAGWSLIFSAVAARVVELKEASRPTHARESRQRRPRGELPLCPNAHVTQCHLACPMNAWDIGRPCRGGRSDEGIRQLVADHERLKTRA